MNDNSLITNYLPIAIQAFVALGFVTVAIIASWLLGPKVYSKSKLEAFESGIPSVGNARTRFSIKYFLVATLFVLFDVEVIFFYPWAVNFREFSESMGWDGFLRMLLFMSAFVIGFIYVIKKKALDWD